MATPTRVSNTALWYLGLTVAVAVIVKQFVPSVPGWDHTINIAIIMLAMWPWMTLTYHQPWWRVGLGTLAGIAGVAVMERLFG